MRVLLGIRCLIRPKTGIGHHTQELLKSLRSFRSDVNLGVFPQPGILQASWAWYEFAPRLKRSICSLLGSSKRGESAGETPPASAQRTWEEKEEATRTKQAPLPFRMGAAMARNFYRFFLNEAFHKGRYDLYHEPNYFPVPCEMPTLVTIHDLSAILHPEWHPNQRVKMHKELMERLVPGREHFMTVSHFVKNQMVEKLGVSPDRIHVSCNGVRSHLRPLPSSQIDKGLKALGLPRGYFLHVGTIEPRKNLGLLLDAWSDLPGSIRSKHPLVLAGSPGWKDHDTLDRIQTLKSKGLIHLGYVPEGALAALYGGALGLVFPSHDEGFGMPPVEMQACGGAVITAPAGAVEEVVSPAAHILRGGDAAAWRDAMLRLAMEPAWRESLQRGAVESAARFTWDRCARESIAAYRTILGLVPGQPKAKVAA